MGILSCCTKACIRLMIFRDISSYDARIWLRRCKNITNMMQEYYLNDVTAAVKRLDGNRQTIL